MKHKIVKLALAETELSPRKLAVTFTGQERYSVSEFTVYRVLKAHDLVTSPAFTRLQAANQFKDRTTGISQLWQTGNPVPSSRFMGGREYELIQAGQSTPSTPQDIELVLGSSLMIVPAVAPSIGPFQGQHVQNLPLVRASMRQPCQVISR